MEGAHHISERLFECRAELVTFRQLRLEPADQVVQFLGLALALGTLELALQERDTVFAPPRVCGRAIEVRIDLLDLGKVAAIRSSWRALASSASIPFARASVCVASSITRRCVCCAEGFNGAFIYLPLVARR